MSLNQVYITKTGHFLPNEPVINEEMENYLGLIDGKPSKAKKIVLRNNGIKRRFYAIDKEGKPTHSNAALTALAIRNMFRDDPGSLQQIDLLCCGTSSPDQMMPSHGVMVHGWLPESGAIEVVSPSGVCCAGMHAFKYAYMAVKTGNAGYAVATGSERFSPSLKSEVFEDEVKHLIALEENPYISFDKDFLRWMLSDGAGSFLLTNAKSQTGVSLRVEWVEGVSYAHEKDTCMYMACEKEQDGTVKSYLDYTPSEIIARSVLSIKQDTRLLGENIVPLGGLGLKSIFQNKGLDVNEIDYFLPHISSEFFRGKIAERLAENGMPIPPEKWFVNLPQVGNVGAGSIFLMVDELLHSGRLQPGEKILMLVPESSRFSYMYALLTVC
jgi:3-oxoacyl-[acyl-carrier-protein] synthase-3